MCREPDLNLSPLSRLAGISKSVITSVKDLKSPVRIINSNICASGLAVSVSGENSGKDLRRNSNTIIRNKKNNILIFHPSCNYDRTGFGFFFQDSVKNGILHNGLKSQLRDLVFRQLIRDIKQVCERGGDPQVFWRDVPGPVYKYGRRNTGEGSQAVCDKGRSREEHCTDGRKAHGC